VSIAGWVCCNWNVTDVWMYFCPCRYQQQYKMEAMRGMGVDRHLFGLYVVAKGMNLDPMPKMFEDKVSPRSHDRPIGSCDLNTVTLQCLLAGLQLLLQALHLSDSG